MPRADRHPRSLVMLVGACALALASVLVLARVGRAAGPLVINDLGTPLVWSGGVVTWNPDVGPLGSLSNDEAVAVVAESFARWQAVPTAALAISNAGPLPENVTVENVGRYLGICSDDVNPIVFDDDGSITDALLGTGASGSVLGFAGPECGSFATATITGASAVLNGKFVDGIRTAGNPEISLEAFAAVFLHEFGHYLDLDHSQVNLLEAFDGDDENDNAVATMFPFLVKRTPTLARDDEVAISTLYPTPDFAHDFGRITGRVLRSDAVTPFRGAYVIARNVADPRHDAIAYASGARFAANATDLEGFFELPGLAAGASYTVEVEPIYAGFTGGSSVGPFSIPVPLPGPPEFWSGADEAAQKPPDDPRAPGVPILAVAGATSSGIDIILNTTIPPANDDCATATTIASFPFTDRADTTNATTAFDDPVAPCTKDDGQGVWYRFTAPADGVVDVSTAASSYDTVLTAYTGTCGDLTAIACNDDDAGTVQSAIGFPVARGAQYLLAITRHGTADGGALALDASFSPGTRGTCDVPAPGACIPGKGRAVTDCITEWLVQPVPAVERATNPRRNIPAAVVKCHDGDPTCDFDGSGVDGGCTFHVAVCVNPRDPRPAVTGCAATALASYVIQQPSTRARAAGDIANGTALRIAVAALAGRGASINGGIVSFAPPTAVASRCTGYQNIRVSRGTRTLRTRATTDTGVVDADQLTLRCVR